MPVRIRLIIFSICFVLEMGCTKGGRFGGASGTVSEEFITALTSGKLSTVTNAISSAAGSASGSRSILRRLANRVAFRYAASPFTECQPTFDGDRTDGDKDGIWTSASVSIECVSGSDKISGSIKLIDENDSLKLPNAGVYAELTSGKLDIGYTGGKRLIFTADKSHVDVKIATTLTSLDLSALVALSSSEGWAIETGAELTGSYLGDINKGVAGDTSKTSGFLKLKTTSVPEMPDVNVVISIEGSLTMGTCPGKTKIEPVSGEVTLADGSGNSIKLTSTDCVATVTYNGKSLQDLHTADWTD